MKSARLFVAMTVTVLFASAPAGAADAEAGKTIFNRCKVCHRLDAGAPGSLGPNLHGLFGRKAGSLEGFNYSEAMKNSSITWNDETLAKYLGDPRTFIPGNKMAFPGLKNDSDIANVLAYLKDATK
jgi:cytochrome c